jgi:hypothetical protein
VASFVVAAVLADGTCARELEIIIVTARTAVYCRPSFVLDTIVPISSLEAGVGT